MAQAREQEEQAPAQEQEADEMDVVTLETEASGCVGFEPTGSFRRTVVGGGPCGVDAPDDGRFNEPTSATLTLLRKSPGMAWQVRADSLKYAPFWASATVTAQNVRDARSSDQGRVPIKVQGGRLSDSGRRIQATLLATREVEFVEQFTAEEDAAEAEAVVPPRYCWASVWIPWDTWVDLINSA